MVPFPGWLITIRELFLNVHYGEDPDSDLDFPMHFPGTSTLAAIVA